MTTTTTTPPDTSDQPAAKRAPTPTPFRQPKDIECWGHRGASANLPENTLASFQAAIREGAHGIESDVHATSDGVVLMFHDPTLDRTTTGKGLIRKQPWRGVIEHVRTTKEPVQPIPLFEELVELLMLPENMHVSLNIDCKMQNDPQKLFPEMARIIALHPSWETDLAPRLILGLWHPLFLRAALQHLPLLRRYHIGFSTTLVRKFFWDHCEGFSMCFPLLMGADGQAFLRECRAAGKEVTVWTVNDENEMRVAMTWGVKAVLTDRVATFVKLRNEAISNPAALEIPGLQKYTLPWSSWRYYSISHVGIRTLVGLFLSAHGSLSAPVLPPPPSDLDLPSAAAASPLPATTTTTTTTTTMTAPNIRRRASDAIADFAISALPTLDSTG